MINVDALLQSFGDGAPSGDDLEYEPVFMELELAAQPGEERQIGDAVIAATEPEHVDVVAKAGAVLERSHDLRAAVILAHSALRLEGLPAFEEVLRYIRGCLEQHWDSCHPQLDAEDDNDPTMRINAVVGLTDGDTVLRALRLAPLTRSRNFGEIGLREIAVAAGEMTAPADMTEVPDEATVSAAFQDTDPEIRAGILAAAEASLAHVRAISAIFDDRTPGEAPDLTPLQKLLHRIVAGMAEYSGGEVGEAAPEDAVPEMEVATVDAPISTPAPPRASGAINGPNDVVNMIDRINDYYARNEPSSPVPLLLNRARRLVSADCVSIMRDMAPQGVEQVALIGGFGDDEE